MYTYLLASTFPQILKNGRIKLAHLEMHLPILTLVKPGELCNKLEQWQGKTFGEFLQP